MKSKLCGAGALRCCAPRFCSEDRLRSFAALWAAQDDTWVGLRCWVICGGQRLGARRTNRCGAEESRFIAQETARWRGVPRYARNDKRLKVEIVRAWGAA